MVLESFLGDNLVKNDGTEVKTSELSTEKGGVIGIYFSAHWCPPCRGFTPKLASVYNEIKEAGKDFEIVFVSWDRDEESFKDYHGEQPWLAVPYASSDEKDKLGEKYQVRGIPSLVLLEADTGNTISDKGRTLIDDHGAGGFPFTTERLEEAKKEAKEKKEASLKELADLKFLGSLSTMDEPDQELDITEVARKSEALAFAFMKGSDCQGSDLVLPKLLDIHKKLGKEKLSVIVIPMMGEGDEDFSQDTSDKLKGVPMIPRGERAKGIANAFKPIFNGADPDTPTTFMVDARDESAMKIIIDDASRPIYFKGEDAFPWTEEALKAAEERVEAMKKEMKAKQKNLEFFAPSESCHIVDKQGAEVSLETLQSKDVVGIYFSGHWCGPCRAFTPKLVEMYNQCKEQDKSFEVIFLSSDRDQASFDEYYGEMPWYTLKFEDRALKESLSDIFEVEGIPTLILLKGDGELICGDDDARTALKAGSDYFPWGPEEMKRANEEEEAREAAKAAEAKAKEEAVYAEMEAAGKIAIRRHKGSLDCMKIEADHSIKFESFSTVAAPTAVVPNGKKAWYEITFQEGSGISQMGWATSGFETCDRYTGDGVGDCTKSWGFDGQRVCKWFDGSTSWGKAFEPRDGKVLGVAADMVDGKILFGLDGEWGEPMGVAFEGLDADLGLFPALTGQGMKVSVNFGDREMKFGPPDESFEKLSEVVGK